MIHLRHSRHSDKLLLIGVISLMMMVTVQSLNAQLFPGLEGEELADALRNEYKPSHLLNFTQVKDTLYAKIFFDNDSVRCIYSGLAHYLPHGVDPSQWVFGSGNEVESINLEHGWPQAKGAGDGTNGQMDMYHLFPSRVAINADRADYPYSDINDVTTQTWYYLGQELFTKPSINIDAYSEFIPGFFEPRETVKGDIARAMFYFWTMYRDDAVTADPNYFEQQRTSLCLWHEEDPVDGDEVLRNDMIATYQGNKKNPFILDCTLVQRCYCPQNTECTMTRTDETRKAQVVIKFDNSLQRFQIESDENRDWKINIVNLYGQILYSETVLSNQWSSNLELPTGLFILWGQDGIEKVVAKLFIHR